MPDEELPRRYADKRTRTGEAINMKVDDKWWLVGRTSLERVWIRFAALLMIRETSGAAYGNSISFNRYIQSRREKVGVNITVAQERDLAAKAKAAEKAQVKLREAQMKLAEREVKAQERQKKKEAKEKSSAQPSSSKPS